MDDKINYKILYLKYKNKYKNLKGGNNILFNKYSKKTNITNFNNYDCYNIEYNNYVCKKDNDTILSINNIHFLDINNSTDSEPLEPEPEYDLEDFEIVKYDQSQTLGNKVEIPVFKHCKKYDYNIFYSDIKLFKINIINNLIDELQNLKKYNEVDNFINRIKNEDIKEIINKNKFFDIQYYTDDKIKSKYILNFIFLDEILSTYTNIYENIDRFKNLKKEYESNFKTYQIDIDKQIKTYNEIIDELKNKNPKYKEEELENQKEGLGINLIDKLNYLNFIKLKNFTELLEILKNIKLNFSSAVENDNLKIYKCIK